MSVGTIRVDIGSASQRVSEKGICSEDTRSIAVFRRWGDVPPRLPDRSDRRPVGDPRTAGATPAARRRPPAHARRELINAMLYVLRGGIAWRAMPHDLPPWQSVYHYFRLWRLDGTWEHINAALRERVRRQAGRETTSSVAIIDSQSVKTTEKGGRAATMGARS